MQACCDFKYIFYKLLLPKICFILKKKKKTKTHNLVNNSYKNLKNIYTYVTLYSLNYIANKTQVLIPIRVNLIVPVFYGNIKIKFSITLTCHVHVDLHR